nr:MAG TPA: hypothetical protein [Caudoviricetes sp.]
MCGSNLIKILKEYIKYLITDLCSNCNYERIC